MTSIEGFDLTNTEWLTKAKYRVNVEEKEYTDAYPKGIWAGNCPYLLVDKAIKLWWDLRGNCVMFQLPHKIEIPVNKEEFDLMKNITGLHDGGYVIGDK